MLDYIHLKKSRFQIALCSSENEKLAFSANQNFRDGSQTERIALDCFFRYKYNTFVFLSLKPLLGKTQLG